MISVYVDASFNGRRQGATGLAVIIVNSGLVSGRATATATATSSHHAECMAALLGIRLLGVAVIGREKETAVLHTDDKEVVSKLMSDRLPRNKVLESIFNELRSAAQSIRDTGVELDIVYRSKASDQFMSHVDWLSKTVVNDLE